jgi:hypothetical protein
MIQFLQLIRLDRQNAEGRAALLLALPGSGISQYIPRHDFERRDLPRRDLGAGGLLVHDSGTA